LEKEDIEKALLISRKRRKILGLVFLLLPHSRRRKGSERKRLVKRIGKGLYFFQKAGALGFCRRI